MISDRRAQLAAFLDDGNNRPSYASVETMWRSSKMKVANSLESLGLAGHFEIHKLKNGRVIPVLVFGPTEQVPAEAMAFAWNNFVIFQYRR